MAKYQKNYESPRKLIDALIDTYADNNNFYYRGMHCSSWKLETSYFQFAQKEGASIDPRHTQTDRLLEEFSKNLLSTNSISYKELSGMAPLDIWQYGQHYGLPTPLLDWTKSPFIALFFALCEACETRKPSIWVLNKSMLELFNKTSKLPFNELTFVKPINGINKRINNQNGAFTFSNKIFIHDVWHDKSTEGETYSHPILEQLTFACTENQRRTTLHLLDDMNISYKTLYPDVEGSAKGAKQALLKIIKQSKGFTASITRNVNNGT
jgi:hypothetical protein